MAGEHVLIVDDERAIRDALRGVLEDEGYRVTTAASGADAVTAVGEELPDAVFLDIWMPGMDGLDTLAEMKRVRPDVTVVMISGHGTIETAVKATRLGAYDFIEKPLSIEKTLLTLTRALEHGRLERENATLRAVLETRSEIIGQSQAMRTLREQIAMAAPTNGRVLIHGENGSGKELVARAIHALSARRHQPFVEVNCAAIPDELIESELFGHERGSFTDAKQTKRGMFEAAKGGTLFLDEVGDMSLSAQAKVLRVLQDGVVTRIGGAKPVQVDVRVLAATNKALEDEITAGRFREDLYYRLNVVPVHVPPLRERREDIPLLVQYFAGVLSEREGITPKTIEPEAVRCLTELDWPGNVRELRNTIERLLILSSGPRVTEADVDRLVGRRAAEQTSLGALGECRTFEEFKDAAERTFLLLKLREFDWNVSETARALDMPRSNLYKKIERYALVRESA